MIAAILRFLSGGVVGEITGAYKETLRLRLAAENDEKRLELDRQLESLANQREIALAELRWRWNPVTVGRYLIVVPFGIWWAGIFIVSIVNPNFGTVWVVQAVPANIMSMAQILVPGIIVADAGLFIGRRYLRR